MSEDETAAESTTQIPELEQALAHDEARKQAAAATGQKCSTCLHEATYLGGRSYSCQNADCEQRYQPFDAPPLVRAVPPESGAPVPMPVDRKRQRIRQLQDYLGSLPVAVMTKQRDLWPAICEFANLRLEDALARTLASTAAQLQVDVAWLSGLPVLLASEARRPPPLVTATEVERSFATLEPGFAEIERQERTREQRKSDRAGHNAERCQVPKCGRLAAFPPWHALEISQGEQLDVIGRYLGRHRLARVDYDAPDAHPETDVAYRDDLRKIANHLSETEQIKLRLDVVLEFMMRLAP